MNQEITKEQKVENKQKIKVVIHGFGNMGRLIYSIANKHNVEVVGVVDSTFDFANDRDLEVQKLKLSYESLNTFEYDVLIDFSHFSKVDALLDVLEQSPHKAIIATTKLSENQLTRIKALSEKVAVYQDYNTSYGVFVLNETLKFMTSLLDEYDIELIETHHKYKVDAPSGTAVRLVDTIASQRDLVKVHDYSTKSTAKSSNEIGVHAIRLGNVVGDHEVIFGTDHDIISIKHHALSKNLFAEGTLKICKQLQSKNIGLFKLEEVFKA